MLFKSLINVSKRSLNYIEFRFSSQDLIRTDITFIAKKSSLLVLSRSLVSISSDKMRGGSKADFKRLPTNVSPINYAITLKPNLKSFTYSGSESVKVKVNEETKTIVLNSLELEINAATYTSESGKSILQNLAIHELSIKPYFRPKV